MTLSNFETEVYELIDETESNIYDIEKLIFTNRYNFVESDFKMLSKQSIVMLYSLWEGFVQQIFSRLLTEIDRNVSSLFDLCDDLLVSQIEKTFPQFNAYPTKTNGKLSFHRYLNEFISRTEHELKLTVNCKNNVELDVLNGLLQIHGMHKIPDDWKQYKRPNKNLKKHLKDFLHFRNNQAHGNSISTDVEMNHSEFEEYKKVIIDLLYEVGDRIIDCVQQQSYKKDAV